MTKFKRKYYALLKKLNLIDLKNYLIKHGAKIGQNVYICPNNNKIDGLYPHLLEIGDNVTIAEARLIFHDISSKNILHYSKIGKIKIGNNVCIGHDAIIMPNVHIGNKVIIKPGTYVNKDIPNNSVIQGNPFKIICSYNDYVQTEIENFKKVPHYDDFVTEKSDEKLQQMCKDVENNFAYDGYE